MSEEEFISTGIEKLDNLLEGGIPKGFTTLILGSPGSSIEILSKQLATTGDVLYFTTEETKEEVVSTMARFGWKPANVDFVDIKDKTTLSIRTYERGVEGETLACGTGVVAAAIISGVCEDVVSPVRVHTRGGEVLTVYYDIVKKEPEPIIENVYLEGNVRLVYKGEIEK